MTDDLHANDANDAIAVIGMAGRFPKARDVEAFWAACRDGVECLSRWHVRSRHRVPAGGLLADQDLFDAGAFGVSPAEAELLDPQHRIFLEVCWDGLEHASVVPDEQTLVSVYAAAAPSRYHPAPAGADGTDENARYQRMIANGPDYLATRVSYLLDLRGEAVNVQTACSSSLVAVHLACQSLQAGRSDVALAGGVSIDPEQDRGYVHQEGMIASPDGRCLPFDEAARGAVPGNGAAVVVLQRLDDALAQGRRVHAVIRATAVNNDGRAKSGFMAPNVRGQSEVIATALAVAGVRPESIGYLEAHGTGTRLGDPIEVEAARTAFGTFTERRGFCALGSLKANFGHLDRAAGVAGLIKAVCAVRDGQIPPLIGFTAPNPDLHLEESPFRIPTSPEAWRPPWPRRAGVSSFGVGGTNAHAIVEQFPASDTVSEPRTEPDDLVALPLSAHDRAALAELGRNLAGTVEGGQAAPEVTHTLATGRLPRPVRTVVVGSTRTLGRALRDLPPTVDAPAATGRLALLFPGQGAQVCYDAGRLAARYPVFRDELRRFADALGTSVDRLADGVSGSIPAYREFAYQPALAAVQVGLARLAEHAGVVPDALCGSSVGEYAAAHLAGVFSHADLMTVLAARDAIMRAAPEGRMMVAWCSADEAARLLDREVDLAGDNGADRVLLSGRPAAIERQRALLAERGVVAKVLPGRVAPHGRLMAGAQPRLREAFDGIGLARADRPIVSTLTGTWATPEELADPAYWVRHLCEPLRFRQALHTLAAAGYDRFVECSPGSTLTRLVGASHKNVAVATTLGGDPDTDPVTSVLAALGELWCSGIPVRWDVANRCTKAAYTVLPPYPFQRSRFWSHRPAGATAGSDRSGGDGGERSRVLEAPVWRPRPRYGGGRPATLPRAVILHGGGALGLALGDRLAGLGVPVTTSQHAAVDAGSDAVLVDLTLAAPGRTPVPEPADAAGLAAWLQRGLLDPLAPVRRLRPHRHLTVARGAWPVLPGECPDTAGAAAVGMVRCAPHEWPGLDTAIVDLDPDPAGAGLSADVEALVDELALADDGDIAYRGSVRYRRGYEPMPERGPSRLREAGCYLVLGGTGRLGAVVAEAISREVTATIVLTGRDLRRPIPPHAEAALAAARRRGCRVVRRELHSDDPGALRAVLHELAAEHGRVDGIFHLAAHTVTADFDLLADTTTTSAGAIAKAKVCTAALLAEQLADRDYDFVALFSSISTVIGALRFGVYVGANAYLDALAARMQATSGRTWLSLAWDGWTADGMATANGLGSDDGARLLGWALRGQVPVLAPVTQPVERRIDSVRADLASVARAEREAAHAGAEGASVAEEVLRVVAKVTGHVGIDPRCSFASLGVDSLQLMQIAVRLRPLLGQAFAIGSVLAARSAAEIVALVFESDTAHPAGSTAVAVDDRELSTPQQRLWYLAQLNPDSSGYNVPFGWLMPCDVDEDTVRAAVSATLERHEMLRSAYPVDDQGRPVRLTIDPLDVEVVRTHLDPADTDGTFRRAARDFVERPFDLHRGSTRVLIATGAGPIRVVFVCHHMSIDAWSVRLVHDNLFGALSDPTTPAVPVTASYRDFVQWERDNRGGPDHERLAQYWRRTLRDVAPTEPPPDDGVDATNGRPVGVATAVLPHARLEELRTALRGHGATLYTAGLTGLSLALGQWCGTPEVVIGTNLANRTREEFETVVGLFVDPVVVRLAPGLQDTAASIGSALANVREQFTTAIAHSGIPYLDVVGLSGRSAGRSGGAADNPLFSIIATMFDTEGAGPGLAALELPLPATSKFALAVEFLPRTDGLLIHVLYRADRYLPTTVDRLLERTVRYLEALAVDGPDTPLSELFPERAGTPAPERFARRFAHLGGTPSATATSEGRRQP